MRWCCLFRVYEKRTREFASSFLFSRWLPAGRTRPSRLDLYLQQDVNVLVQRTAEFAVCYRGPLWFVCVVHVPNFGYSFLFFPFRSKDVDNGEGTRNVLYSLWSIVALCEAPLNEP